MGWVVKSFRTDAWAALACARREVSDSAAYLEALERFGVETRAQVRADRARLLGVPLAPRVLEPRPSGSITARRGRATMHDSPLTELFAAAVARS